jgi:hypothetical protein
MAIFDETYRVIAVESQSLVVRGNVTGEILTIMNDNPEVPIREEDYPVGQLIALSDPSQRWES